MDENIFYKKRERECRIGLVSIGKTYNAPTRERVLSGRRGEFGNIRGGCRRCSSRGLGWWRGAGSLRRRSGGNRDHWRFVSASE